MTKCVFAAVLLPPMVTLSLPVASMAVVSVFAVSVSLTTQLIDDVPGQVARAFEYRPRKPAPSVAVTVRLHKIAVAPAGGTMFPPPPWPAATTLAVTTRSAEPNASLPSASRESYTRPGVVRCNWPALLGPPSLRHVPGVPLATHRYTLPLASISISPTVWASTRVDGAIPEPVRRRAERVPEALTPTPPSPC